MLFQICVPNVVPFAMNDDDEEDKSGGEISLEPILVFVAHVMSFSTICRIYSWALNNVARKKECERTRKHRVPRILCFPLDPETNCILFRAVTLSAYIVAEFLVFRFVLLCILAFFTSITSLCYAFSSFVDATSSFGRTWDNPLAADHMPRRATLLFSYNRRAERNLGGLPSSRRPYDCSTVVFHRTINGGCVDEAAPSTAESMQFT